MRLTKGAVRLVLGIPFGIFAAFGLFLRLQHVTAPFGNHGSRCSADISAF